MSVDVHQILSDLTAGVRSVQLHPYTGGSLSELAEDLALRFGKVLGECLTGLSAVKENAPEGSSLHRLCELVLTDLRFRADLLVELGAGSPGEVAERWLPSAAEALDTLESALWAVSAELVEDPAAVDEDRAVFCGEPEPSLCLRRAYAKLRRQIRRARSRHPRRLEPFLRSSGTSLVRFLGRDEAADLPLLDRLRLYALRDRILAWLRAGDRPLETGLQLRGEVLLAVESLGRLNGRPELVEHDRRRVAELVRLLSFEPVHGSVPAGAVHRLHALLGRADSLDDMILGGTDVSALLGRLLRLFRILEGGRCRSANSNRPPDSRRGGAAARAGKQEKGGAAGRAA